MLSHVGGFEFNLNLTVGGSGRAGTTRRPQAHVIERHLGKGRRLSRLADTDGPALPVGVGNQNRRQGLSRDQVRQVIGKRTWPQGKRESGSGSQPHRKLWSRVHYTVFPTTPFNRRFPLSAITTHPQRNALPGKGELGSVEVDRVQLLGLP